MNGEEKRLRFSGEDDASASLDSCDSGNIVGSSTNRNLNLLACN